MLEPVNIHVPKKRFGNKEGDGGYVIPDSVFGAKAIFGYGVDRDVTFETELTEKFNIPAYVFDHTIDTPPPMGQHVRYYKEGITGGKEEHPLYNLSTHVNRFLPEGDYVLKMDVEGAEWDVIKTSDFSRVSMLIIELHELEAAPRDAIQKLNDTFHLVHLHANNCHNQPTFWLDRVHDMPRYLEAVWVRKDLVADVSPNVEEYPTPLDIKCRPDAPDICPLEFWKPCPRPFTFVAPDESQRETLRKIVCKEDEIISEGVPKHSDVLTFKTGDQVSIPLVLNLKNVPVCKEIYVPICRRNFNDIEKRITSSGEGILQLNIPIFNL